MTPAMVLSWFFGLILISIIGFDVLLATWTQLKLIFVVLLSFYHFYLGHFLSKLKSDQNIKTSRFFRIINEVPTVLLILIVFIVIFKPL
jgi:putative membrane protein